MHLHEDPDQREFVAHDMMKNILNAECKEEYGMPYSELGSEQQVLVLYVNLQIAMDRLLQRDSYIGDCLDIEMDELHGFFNDLDFGKGES